MSTNARDRLAALALVTAPVVLGVGLIVHPKEVTSESEQLRIISDHATAWGVAHVLIYLGSTLLVGAVIALVRLADRHGGRGALGAGVVAGFGAVALASAAAIEMATRHIVESAGVAGSAAGYHSYTTANDLGIVVFLPEFALSVGFVGLAFVLWRSAAVAAWSGVAIGVGVVLAPVPVVGARDLGAMVFTAGMCAAAAAVLRAPSGAPRAPRTAAAVPAVTSANVA
jgi:hypothetical protein